MAQWIRPNNPLIGRFVWNKTPAAVNLERLWRTSAVQVWWNRSYVRNSIIIWYNKREYIVALVVFSVLNFWTGRLVGSLITTWHILGSHSFRDLTMLGFTTVDVCQTFTPIHLPIDIVRNSTLCLNRSYTDPLSINVLCFVDCLVVFHLSCCQHSSTGFSIL